MTSILGKLMITALSFAASATINTHMILNETKTEPKQETTMTQQKPKETEAKKIENNPELEELAKTVSFKKIPETIVTNNKTYITKTVSTTGYETNTDYAEKNKFAQFLNNTKEEKDNLMTDKTNIIVSIPQSSFNYQDNNCTHLGETLLLKTAQGKLIRARVGDIFNTDNQITDKDTNISAEKNEDNAYCIKIWTKNEQEFDDPIVEIANLGFDQEWSDFETKLNETINTEATSEPEVTKTQELGAQAFIKAAQEELEAWNAGQRDRDYYVQPYVANTSDYDGGFCGMFIGIIGDTVGSTAIHWNGDCIPSDPTTPSNYKKWYDTNPDAGTLYNNGPGVKPKPGDILLMWEGSHVEIVESVDDEGFWTIGGGEDVHHDRHDFESSDDTWFITPNWEQVQEPKWNPNRTVTINTSTTTTTNKEQLPETLGKWDASKTLIQDKSWFYVKDIILEDGASAEAVNKAGIIKGDILANGTNSSAPARQYLGDDGDGNALWQLADSNGQPWENHDWQNDTTRRSIWRKNPNTTTSTTTITETKNGTQKFIESCKKESDDWANGNNADQPWKYIDYWKNTVPNGNSIDWGGQCSEYILWNLANIGLVPGKTMASLDTINWGARCELAFLQEHPEYGEIHALDGGEDGCISGYYVPRPGDICIHNHGDHFEMVSEVFDDHWEGYSSGSEGCGPTSHPIDKDPNATNHDGYYVFLTIDFDKALADR